eukprot:UN02410
MACLDSISHSRVGLSLVCALNLICLLILLILTIDQSDSVESAGAGDSECSCELDSCSGLNLLTPFRFSVSLTGCSKSCGVLQCPWPDNNFLYRLILTVLNTLTTLFVAYYLFYEGST